MGSRQHQRRLEPCGHGRRAEFWLDYRTALAPDAVEFADPWRAVA